MKMPKSLLPVSAALLALLSFPAFADPGKVVIGLIDDMSGLYADINGPGAVEAIKMAISAWSKAASSAATRSRPSDDPISPPVRFRLKTSPPAYAGIGISRTNCIGASM